MTKGLYFLQIYLTIGAEFWQKFWSYCVTKLLEQLTSALMELQNQSYPFQAQMPSHFIDMSPLHCEKMS